MRGLLIGMMVVLTTGGCSSVDVNVAESDSQPPHEKVFPREMTGRSTDYTRPRVLEMPAAEYPPEAAAQELAGIVMIKVLVGYDGKVVETRVQQGLRPIIDQAALEAARGGRYAPATRSGVSIDDWITIPFRYPPDPVETD